MLSNSSLLENQTSEITNKLSDIKQDESDDSL